MDYRKHICSGTSLPASALPQTGWDLWPPIKRGDLSRMCLGIDSVVLIVDGAFGSVESVDLTEIRASIAKGARIFGCSSMGALRAVEAKNIGMIGLGTVYREMVDRAVIDDAIVAQATCPETHRALSISYVEVEYSLRVARDSEQISNYQYEQSCDLMRKIFYPNRTARKVYEVLVGIIGMEPSKNVIAAESIKKLDALFALREIDKMLGAS